MTKKKRTSPVASVRVPDESSSTATSEEIRTITLVATVFDPATRKRLVAETIGKAFIHLPFPRAFQFRRISTVTEMGCYGAAQLN